LSVVLTAIFCVLPLGTLVNHNFKTSKNA
jgi:hypothetical protein